MKELTVLEQVIMAAIWGLKEDAYGVSIRKRIIDMNNRKLMYGTLYNSLDQLVRKGYVSKSKGEPTAERGGRSKIYYHLSEEGKLALKAAFDLQKSIWKNIPDFVKEKNVT